MGSGFPSVMTSSRPGSCDGLDLVGVASCLGMRNMLRSFFFCLFAAGSWVPGAAVALMNSRKLLREL